MITIQTTITPQRITRSLAGDWGPAWRRWAGAVVIPVVAVFTAGLMTGEAWHRMLAWAEGHHLQGLSRMGLPGGNYPEFPDSSIQPVSDAFKLPVMVTQRQAPAMVPTITRRSECRRLRAQGLSPAAIGRELGISRTTVRRDLQELSA